MRVFDFDLHGEQDEYVVRKLPGELQFIFSCDRNRRALEWSAIEWLCAHQDENDCRITFWFLDTDMNIKQIGE